jgi:hypothetical protein
MTFDESEFTAEVPDSRRYAQNSAAVTAAAAPYTPRRRHPDRLGAGDAAGPGTASAALGEPATAAGSLVEGTRRIG